jgi:hypothetical protein
MLVGLVSAPAQLEEPAEIEEKLTGQGHDAIKLFATLNQMANAETLAVTASKGHPRQPNAWPGGCGPLRPAPLG